MRERLVARERGGRCRAELVLGAAGLEALPGPFVVRAELGRELRELLGRQQRGVVLRVALDRQRPALDRVGEHHRRPVVLHGAVGVDQLAEVMTAEVPEARPQLRIVELVHQPRQRGVVAGKPLTQLGAGGAQEPLVLLVRHLVDTAPQASAARPCEQVVEHAPVLDGDHLPAGGVEHPGEPAEGDVRHHAVERLPVEVDDPEHLAEMGDPRVGDRLPDGTLVELGVAEQGDLAAHRRRIEAVVLEIAARDRTPDRRRGPDADGAGRVVDRVRVLGAARVALQSAELAQRLEVRLFEPAEQVVDRVQDGRSVRLHRHAVLGAELREPQGRHQADHRGARGLMAADLHTRAALADTVRVVDDRGGEPEDPALHGPERLEIRLRERRRRLRRDL